jgi:1,4-dihydroxy-2-naphthoyl-CoA hydrolase
MRAMPELPSEISNLPQSAFAEATGFVIDGVSPTELVGHVDAGADHHQPFGIVHGGLYATIVESACSIGATVAVWESGRHAVGLSNHTDFIRAHREGRLDVRAWPVHVGRTGQLWQCDLTRADGKLVAQGRVRLQNVENAVS